jgi:predicted ATPase
VSQAREVAGAGALEFHLTPLSTADSQQLVSNLLNIDALPAPVRQLILTKAEGNPFFVEEVLRMLIDRGLVVRRAGQWMTVGEIQGLDIPDTVSGVLAARIDRLPEEARYVLQIASVMGRQFYTRILATVLEREAPA